MESNTTTESLKEETSTDSVTPQVETTTTNDSTVTEETSETTTTTDKQPSLDDLQAQVKRMENALKKANKEAQTSRHEASELKKFKEQVESEKLSEAEKQELAKKTLEQKLAEAQKLYNDTVLEKQEIRVRHALQLQAAKLGVEPDVAEKLIDRAEIEHDDDGNPKNIGTLLADLIKSKPYLVKSNGRQAPTTSGGATNPPRSSTSGATTASEYIKRMEQGKLSDSEYSALPASMKHEIQAELIKVRSRRR